MISLHSHIEDVICTPRSNVWARNSMRCQDPLDNVLSLSASPTSNANDYDHQSFDYNSFNFTASAESPDHHSEIYYSNPAASPCDQLESIRSTPPVDIWSDLPSNHLDWHLPYESSALPLDSALTQSTGHQARGLPYQNHDTSASYHKRLRAQYLSPFHPWSPATPSYAASLAPYSRHAQSARQHAPRSVPFTSAAHAAVRAMAIDQHVSGTSAEDVPGLLLSRQSTSSLGAGTPMTPRDEPEDKAGKPANDYPRGPVELYRTESAACQDELYNPANFATPSSQPKPQPPKLEVTKESANPQADLVSERLKNADSVRARSPVEPDVRQQSPFRRGAELAPDSYLRTQATMPSAAALRRQQKDQADQKEYRAHQPPLRRELTKTMSPKDALLDAPDYERGSTFNDIIPEGYEKHVGGSESFADNYVTGSTKAFERFVPLNANTGGFRGVDLNNFLQSPMPDAAFNPPTSTQESERPPEFPRHPALITMESSASENMPVSSQDSSASPVIQRPANTSANTGSYTCTAPSCTQRFESAAKLAKHRRDAHPPTPAVSSTTATPSARSSMSPSTSAAEDSETLGSSMSSSALLARNSQAGPHKCTRINPTTGKPCNTVFSRPYDLTRHEDTIHDRIKQKVQCQYCKEEKSFSRNDALTRHMRVVHPEVNFDAKKGRKDFL